MLGSYHNDSPHWTMNKLNLCELKTPALYIDVSTMFAQLECRDDAFLRTN